jgi:excisionase family DNA binding protein
MKDLEENQISEEKLLKPSDVAEYLNISRAMSYRLLQSGKIPVIRINRIVRVRPNDLQIFLDQQRVTN